MGEWPSLLFFFGRQSHQSCFPWPSGSEWHCFISFAGSLINHVSSHDQQGVSDTTLFLCMAISHQSCLIPWSEQIVSFVQLVFKWFHGLSSCDQELVSDMPSVPVTFFISHRLWECILFFIRKYPSYDDQQQVSNTTSSYGSCYISLHEQQEVSNTTLYVQSHPPNVISWWIESQSCFWHNMLLHLMCQLMFGRM